MDTFSDTEMIKLAALAGAFVIGVIVCVYVVVKETRELKRRRIAKRLMYEDQVRREVARKKAIRERAGQDGSGDTQNGQSFA